MWHAMYSLMQRRFVVMCIRRFSQLGYLEGARVRAEWGMSFFLGWFFEIIRRKSWFEEVYVLLYWGASLFVWCA
jgi:hypothetical protein